VKSTVSLVKCRSYDYAGVRSAVERSIENLGGLGRYINKGDRVLLKPNLLIRKKPEDACTTHPAVIKALAEILIEYGSRVVIGDSPGGPFSSVYLNSVYKQTGMEWAAKESGAVLNSNTKSFEKANPRGLLLKKATLAEMLCETDKVISVAKLKTHGLMTYTGAVKNMFGLVPGITKAEYHLNMPGTGDFADAMIDVCLCVDPVLSFIDGIVGMEGDGPSAGTTVESGVLLSSPCPYRLDMAACSLIGFGTNEVPLLRRLAERKMISADMSDIEYAGDSPDSLGVRRFIPPKSHGVRDFNETKAPGIIKKFLSRFVQTRPFVSNVLCSGCGVCKESCPAGIIKIDGSKAKIDYKSCIRCYCCQELCPQKSVGIKRPPLSYLMRL